MLLFGITLLVTTGAMLTFIYLNRTPRAPEFKPVAPNLYIASQIQLRDLRALWRQGVSTIVDLRPDGEEAGQAPSTEIEQAAKAMGFTFYYVPVPHGDIPDQAVTDLAEVLSRQKTPTLLYCRSGRRAVRTLALVQAAQPNGPSAEKIGSMVVAAGFPVEDLQPAIARRIAQRSPTNPVAATP